MQFKPLLGALAYLLIFTAVPASDSAYAFNLKKMMETIRSPQSPGDSEADTSNKDLKNNADGKRSGLGGLFGSGGKSEGMPGSGGNASSVKSDPYQGSNMLRLACEGPKKASALYGGASKSSLDQWSDRVLQDIGVAPGVAGRSDTLAIMDPPIPEFNGLKWAELVGFYGGSFLSKKIKMEIELWGSKPEERLNIAGRLRKAANDENLDDEDRADAKFAYALVLAHFAGELKSNDTVEKFLKAAWSEDSIGALYVRGVRMYRGLSFPKDVNGASNFVYAAHQRVLEIMERAEEDGERSPDLWDEPEKLWTLFATDPAYKDHKRFQSLAADAARIRASLQKEVNKGAKGALSQKIKQLTTIRRNSEMLIAEAFGYGKKLAEANKSIEDLENKADGNGQVIKKVVSMEDDSRAKLTEYIARNNQTLGPDGLKLATRAKQGAVYVATEAFKMASTTVVLAPGSGSSIGGAVQGFKAAERARNLSCQLNEAIVTYTKRKSLRLEAPDLNADPIQLEKLSKEGGAS